MIVKLTLVNVCMNTFITNVSLLIYRELLTVTKKRLLRVKVNIRVRKNPRFVIARSSLT